MSAMIIEPRGVCSRRIEVAASNGVIEHVRMDGGCPGLSRALCNLLEGMPVVEAVQRLKGVPCGTRGTSCPNEIALALEEC